eukprot:TRINITY_DN1834_c0_g6_i1.p1 TRINITY_DN1834_c0_g6~~TRINITY_DN1834_c0_g6_i1.p1  ORF type:complete len:580 (-),score=151.26 TRINITY_DN1834_c0_g6_i1:72-1811(-)
MKAAFACLVLLILLECFNEADANQKPQAVIGFDGSIETTGSRKVRQMRREESVHPHNPSLSEVEEVGAASQVMAAAAATTSDASTTAAPATAAAISTTAAAATTTATTAAPATAAAATTTATTAAASTTAGGTSASTTTAFATASITTTKPAAAAANATDSTTANATSASNATNASNATKASKTAAAVVPAKSVDSFMDIFSCGLLCSGHASIGCCSFKQESGECQWHNVGTMDDLKDVPGWTSARCEKTFGVGRCGKWKPGLCSGKGGPASLPLPKWKLVFEDQFNHSSCVQDAGGIWRPDPKTWTHETGYKRGKESQWYQAENAECKEDMLIITAKRETGIKSGPKCVATNAASWLTDDACSVCAPPTLRSGWPCNLVQNDGSGKPACDCSKSALYTSAALMSQGKKQWVHGRFELKAKIDVRPGSWPSWWAVGDFENTPWPWNGEIDMMEGFRNIVRSNVVFAGDAKDRKKAVHNSAARMVDAEWAESFHVWQMDWDEEQIVIRLDGEQMLKLNTSVADDKEKKMVNPFKGKKPFFMILNQAIGGNLGGDPANTSFPVYYKIDYVRVYQNSGSTVQ